MRVQEVATYNEGLLEKCQLAAGVQSYSALFLRCFLACIELDHEAMITMLEMEMEMALMSDIRSRRKGPPKPLQRPALPV